MTFASCTGISEEVILLNTPRGKGDGFVPDENVALALFHEANDAFVVFEFETLQIQEVNPACLRITGLSRRELIGIRVTDLIVGETTELEGELEESVASTRFFRSREGYKLATGPRQPLSISLTVSRIHAEPTRFGLLVFRNISNSSEELMRARVRVSECASTSDLDDVLRTALDEAERLTDSQIGFLHFLDRDQKSLSLQMWSTNTLQNMCTVEEKDRDYSIAEAGVWVDCVHKRGPVIHNDYASLPHRKGMPEGHAPVVRELVVPVVHNELIVAILGVGNKPSDYREEDVERVSTLANLAWDIVMRKQAEEALRESEERLSGILRHSSSFIFMKDVEGRYLLVNRRYEELFHITNEQIHGKTSYDLFPKETADAFRRNDLRVLSAGTPIMLDEEIPQDDGVHHYLTLLYPVRNSRGAVTAVCGIATDITDRKRAEGQRLDLERQVQQSQKLESLGVLAGGIAHDFNNILMAILGNADMALQDLPEHSPARASLQEIERATRRAAELTRQMLAYSGKGQFVVRLVDLNKTVGELSGLLRSSVSKKVDLKLRLAPDLPAVEADVAQLQQVVMNLATNACESLDEEVGTVTITTHAEHYGREFLARSLVEEEVPEGEYVALEVSDTGCGMDDETKSKIFEPFYTTKFTGRGLGLSAVLGIVRGHNGAMLLETEPGKGTTFTILFPASEKNVPESTSANRERPEWRTTGTILLADDEEAVLRVAQAMLERLGFNVLSAANGREAVDLFRTRRSEIRCVILDLTMPTMDGVQALREIRDVDPNAKAIICSGYAAEQVRAQFAGLESVGVVQKPYTLAKLRESLQQVLETQGGERS